MNKIVNVNVIRPVRLKHPMSMGKYYNVDMDINDIFKCICARAIVDEVLPNGVLLRLDLNNYSKDNTPKNMPVAEKKTEEPDIKEPQKETTEEVKPVVEEQKVEEAVVDEVKTEEVSTETETDVVEPEKETTEEVKPVIEEKKPQHNNIHRNNKPNRK